MSLLSHGAYARSKGWSQQYVSQLVAKGKIPTVGGKIDQAAADKALAETADPRMGGVRKANAARRRSSSPAVPEVVPETEDDDTQRDLDFSGMTQNQAQTAKLRIQAKRETLEYERETRKLVESAEVAKAVADIAPALIQLDGIPDRLIARLRAAPDDRTAYAMLAEEIAACRQAIADFARALGERLTATAQ